MSCERSDRLGRRVRRTAFVAGLVVLGFALLPAPSWGARNAGGCTKFWCRLDPRVKSEIALGRALERLENGGALDEDVETFRAALSRLFRGALEAAPETRARVVFLALELEYFSRDEKGTSDAYVLLGALLGEARELGVRALAHFHRARLRARLSGDPRPELEAAEGDCYSEELREKIVLSRALADLEFGDRRDARSLVDLVERSRSRTTRALAALVLAMTSTEKGADAARWFRTGESEWTARAAASARPPWEGLAVRAWGTELLALVASHIEGRIGCDELLSLQGEPASRLSTLLSCEPEGRGRVSE